MRTLAAAVALLLASCAGPQVAPEVLRIVPLIKAEKYDEAAADPDLLAPAFVEALRELQAEGADPKRIVALADVFFEHYPFSIRDFAVDEALFEAAAEAHFQASMKLKPELPACARFAAARTVEEKTLLLRSGQGPHDDGGRCAKNVADLLHRALRSGPDWDLDPSLSRSAGKEPPGMLLDRLVESSEILEPSPHFLVGVMLGSRLKSLYGDGRRDAWAKWGEVLGEGRWRRIFGARLSLWDALRQKPYFDLRSDVFEASRFDRGLREVGRALSEPAYVAFSLDSEPGDLPALTRAVEEVIRAGRGTPFPDLARYKFVAALVNAGRTDEAEKWLRTHGREFNHPLRLAYSWLFLCTPFTSAKQLADHAGRVMEVSRAAVDAAPGSSSAGEAWVLRARVHHQQGRDTDAIACLQQAVAIPESASGPFEDESAAYARSDAGLMLANLHMDRGEWDHGLAAWEAWKPYSMCVNGSWDQELDLSLGIGRCLEESSRRRDAADHYWNDLLNIAYSVEPAKRMMEVCRSLGNLSQLQDRVREEIKSRGSLSAGLKWLADELKVPIQ